MPHVQLLEPPPEDATKSLHCRTDREVNQWSCGMRVVAVLDTARVAAPDARPQCEILPNHLVLG